MATTNQDSLLSAVRSEKGGFSIPKNLIWIVMGVLVSAVVIILFVQTMAGNAPPPTVKLTPQADTSQPPAPETIEGIARTQTEEAKKQKEEAEKRAAAERAKAAAASQNLPFPGAGEHTDGFPTIDQSGRVALPAPSAGGGASDPRVEAAARENLIRSSPIMAINEGVPAEVSSAAQSPKVKGFVSPEELVAEQVDIRKKALEHINGLVGQGNILSAQAASGKGKLEREWLKESASLKSDREVIRGYRPTSRYMLTQGQVINVVLMTAVNTDLPGEVQARVLMDVYSSIQEDALLVPKGSVIVGTYNSDIRVGQERVNMAFQRMILPNGVSVDLRGNIGMDGAGNGGVPGSVNNHYGQMFLISTLTAVGAYAASNSKQPSSGVTINTGNGGTEAAGQILGDINKAVIERNKVIAPTITIPAGIRFLINVTGDIELPPYRRS